MGQTAEVLARSYGITREESDAFALGSQQKAEAAIAAGRFAEEIVSAPGKIPRESQSTFPSMSIRERERRSRAWRKLRSYSNLWTA